MLNQKAKILIGILAILVLFELGGAIYHQRKSQVKEVSEYKTEFEAYLEKRADESHYFGGANEEELPVQYKLELNGEEVAVLLTAYQFFRPMQLVIQQREVKDEEIETILVQLQEQYNQLILCHQDPAIQNRCENPNCFCADPEIQEFMKLPLWEDISRDNWSVQQFGQDTLLTHNDVVIPEVVLQEAPWSIDPIFFERFDHNHQVLALIEYARDQGFLNEDVTLIHFDTHSDFFIYGDPLRFQESIADYVNTLISKQWIKEMYWVLPDWTKEPEVAHVYWGNTDFGNPYGGHSYAKGPDTLSVYVNSDGILFFEKPEEEVTEILIHRVLQSELPNTFTTQYTYVDIDADYFSNSGYDTEIQSNWNPTEQQLLADLERMAGMLEKIGPDYVSLSLSPGYVSEEDKQVINDYFARYEQE